MISTPSPSAIAVVPLAVPPSIKFNSAGVAVIWSVEAAANGCIVPATLAMLTALSAVGSTTPNVVSKLSALAPSNTTEPLNKTNIRDNLSKLLSDESLVDKAMDGILNNRDKKVSYKLTKHK